ncbi:hypothetical protein A6J39_011615 [Legionella anisa]|uniref:Uncharacterized protein n=1 Tax=Legionella anisa TaxID=28082 RepID=A0AAX0WY43_9GAMM|nr:hypothetical protein DLD14_10835 [Legionella anisa]PNL61804.1 hypothetical protein A6J39_011615 [Legionella anisa]
MLYFTEFASQSVIPAQAGSHFYIDKVLHPGSIPALAGMERSALCLRLMIHKVKPEFLFLVASINGIGFDE